MPCAVCRVPTGAPSLEDMIVMGKYSIPHRSNWAATLLALPVPDPGRLYIAVAEEINYLSHI
jgi:hypothetical protein